MYRILSFLRARQVDDVKYPLDEFRGLMERKLKKDRFQHTLGVERLACELAKCYGVDEDDAALAAITHDMAKEYSLKEQISKAKKWELIERAEDLRSPQVLHGRIAAYILRNEYQILNQDILNAVKHHTTGRPGMSLLEMLIYSADLTEPRREFPGVDKLRDKLYYDLREGTLACVRHTLHYLKETNQFVHPMTNLTYESLINRE